MPNEIPTINRTGIMFRPGDYGKKGVYTDADIDAMAGDTPLPIRMGHYPTLIEKSGGLGSCTRTFAGFDEAGKKVLMGEWAEPLPLSQLLGDMPRSLSVEIDLNTKKPVAVALEVNPHIKDAAFFGEQVDNAFAKFSRGEEVTPLSPTPQEQNMESTTAATPAQETPKVGFVDQIKALFSGARPEDLQQVGPLLVHAETGKTPREIELEAQVAAFEAEQNHARAGEISTQAEAHYQKLYDENKVIPAQKPAVVAAFTAARIFDDSADLKANVACFADGEPAARFSMVSHINELWGKMPAHKKDEEQAGGLEPDMLALFEQEKTTVDDANGNAVPLTRQQELLAMTPVGAAVMKETAQATGGK